MPTAGIVLATPPAPPTEAGRDLSHENIALVGNAARAALDAGLDPVVVVLGNDAEKVDQALKGLSVQRVRNPQTAEGHRSPIGKGLSVLPSRAGAAVFFSAGQSSVTSGMIEALVRAHRRTLAPACQPAFEGKRKVPALFDKALFNELTELREGFGIETLLDRYSSLAVRI
jgi:molybdenum cofactor cytidylyltransferase